MTSEKTKIIITGSAGFLGQNLISRLLNNDAFQIIALSTHPNALREDMSRQDFTILGSDIVFADAASNLMQDAIVVNCAYPRNNNASVIADGLRYVQAVFKSAVDNSAKAIINISSQSVYCSDRTVAATEDSALSLDSVYAVGKYSMELLLESQCMNSKTFFTNIRLGSLIGAGFNQRIVNRFVKSALDMEMISVNVSEHRFGFMDVRDAVEGILSLLKTAPERWESLYNLGNTDGVTVQEIVSTIEKLFRSKNYSFPSVSYQNAEDCSTSAVNCQRLNRLTGFEPHITLEESIQSILNWYLEHSEAKGGKK